MEVDFVLVFVDFAIFVACLIKGKFIN
jgi:hypothetical protein